MLERGGMDLNYSKELIPKQMIQMNGSKTILQRQTSKGKPVKTEALYKPSK